MPPNPPSNAHGFAMRSMSLRDMQIPKSEKKNSWPPPLPNPGDAPVHSLSYLATLYFWANLIVCRSYDISIQVRFKLIMQHAHSPYTGLADLHCKR